MHKINIMPQETPQQRVQRLRATLDTQAQPQVQATQVSTQTEETPQERVQRLRTQVQSGVVEQTVTPEPVKKDGLIKGIAKEIATPFARLGANIAGLLQPSKIPEIREKGVEFPLVGRVKPIESTREAIGAGAEIASTVIPALKAPKVLAPLLKGAVGKSIGTGVATGGVSGGLFGAGRELQAEAPTPSSVLGEAVGAGAFGAIGGGVLGGVGGLLGKAFKGAQTIRDPQTSFADELTDFVKSKRSLERQVSIAKQKNVDVIDLLSEPDIFRGIKVVKGTVDPTDALETMRFRTDTLLDAKRRLLPELEQFAPPITKAEIRKEAVKSLRGTPRQNNITTRQIDAELAAIPDNLPLTVADKLRATVRQSARDARGIQKSDNAFAALETAIRNRVFKATEKTPFNADGKIAALNTQIRDSIEAGTFLDKVLRGQKVAGGKLGIMSGRIFGAIAGAKGGPLGALAGGELGGLISRILMNNKLGSRLQMRLIRSMTDDPKILSEVAKILENIRKFTPPPGLPAPALRIPAREVRSSVRAVSAVKDPKTGVFSSTPAGLLRELRQRPKTSSIIAKTTKANITDPKKAITTKTTPAKVISKAQGVDKLGGRGLEANFGEDLGQHMFVVKQPRAVFRGEGKGIGNTTFVQGRYFADSKKFASTFGDVTEAKIPKGAKVFDFDPIKSNINQTDIPQQILVDPEALTNFLMDRGIKWTKNTNVRGVEYVQLKRTPESTLTKVAEKSDSFVDFISKALKTEEDAFRRISPKLPHGVPATSPRGSGGMDKLRKIYDKAKKK